jgi:CHAT domain-containing protein
MEPSPTIADTAAKPANSQSFTEPPSDLRLSKFAAQVKDPLLRSGLALAGANHGKSGDNDGVLTALEAAYLNLLGTKLVVLSACDTGVGEVKKGEGVQGLRRALVLAGSESQVISLWPVSDEATKDLMIPYYKALQQGEERSEGLRQVQLGMLRGRKDRRHPFYWAAFIQSGEWANLDGKR